MESDALRRVSLILAVALSLGCAVEPPVEVPENGLRSRWFEEKGNLFTVLNGVVVRDRSGEISFEFASMLAIDGHPASAWSSPPGNIEQWLVAELPVRSRIDSVGFSNGAMTTSPTNPKEIRYELSMDGEAWKTVGSFVFESASGNQLRSIEPEEARFIRVTTLSNYGSPTVVNVPTLLLQGEELDAYQRPSAAGHWRLNDLSAHLREDQGRVYGYVEMDPPMLIDGAWDGRIVRFAWSRAPSYGVGLLTLSADGTVLNGQWWYENVVDPGNELGNPWFGTRIGDPGGFTLETPMVAQIHIEREGRFPLFSLTFTEDGALDRSASEPALGFIRTALDSFPQFSVRLQVAVFRSRDMAENLKESQHLRDELVTALSDAGLPQSRLIVEGTGSAWPYPWRNVPLHRAMYSRVDFSLAADE